MGKCLRCGGRMLVTRFAGDLDCRCSMCGHNADRHAPGGQELRPSGIRATPAYDSEYYSKLLGKPWRPTAPKLSKNGKPIGRPPGHRDM